MGEGVRGNRRSFDSLRCASVAQDDSAVVKRAFSEAALELESIAQFAADEAGIVPVEAADGDGVVEHAELIDPICRELLLSFRRQQQSSALREFTSSVPLMAGSCEMFAECALDRAPSWRFKTNRTTRRLITIP